MLKILETIFDYDFQKSYTNIMFKVIQVMFSDFK